MTIQMTTTMARSIEVHGEETFPHECCGFVLGAVDGKTRKVAELLRADNDREDEARHNRFLITPDAYMKGDKEARKKGLDIIGFYHSHPNAEARPSHYDLDHAWPWYSYVIVSIRDQVAERMTSWVLQDDRAAFQQEDILTCEGRAHTTVN